ncbi:MAG TPA: tetratricopeptide repeat protein [Terriglobia bacterium]|nr:tetratricopeptide repeat protein [Terriglobia bacterium]
MRFTKSEILKTLALALVIAFMLGGTPGFTQFKGGGFGGGFKGFGGGFRGFGGMRGRFNVMNNKNRIVDMSADLEELLDPTSTAKPFATVNGTVFGEDGKPVSGITVTIERQDSKGSYKVNSQKNGSYAYDGLPAGQYILGVIYKGEIGLLRDATLRNGRVIVSDFDLKDWVGVAKAGNFDDLKKKLLAGDDSEVEEDTDTRKLPPEIAEQYAKVKAAMDKKPPDQPDYATAAAILKQLVAKEPMNKDVNAWRRLGESSLMLKNYDDAIAAYRKALEFTSGPKASDHMGMLAMALLFKGEFEEAEGLSAKVAEIDKLKGASAYYNLGLALTDKGDGPKAEGAFERATKLDSSSQNAESFYQLGITQLSTHTVPPMKITDAIVPLSRFQELAKGVPDLAEDAATAQLLIDEISKPAQGAGKK